MGLRNRAKGKTEQLTGKAKTGLGRMTGDPQLSMRGRGDEIRGNLKRVAEKLRASLKR